MPLTLRLEQIRSKSPRNTRRIDLVRLLEVLKKRDKDSIDTSNRRDMNNIADEVMAVSLLRIFKNARQKYSTDVDAEELIKQTFRFKVTFIREAELHHIAALLCQRGNQSYYSVPAITEYMITTFNRNNQDTYGVFAYKDKGNADILIGPGRGTGMSGRRTED